MLRQAFKCSTSRLGEHVGVGPIEPLRLGRFGQCHARENRRFGLGAEAFQLLHLVGLAGGAKFGECADAEFLVKLRRLFGTEAGNSHDREHAFGRFRTQFVEHRQRAGVHERDDLVGQISADAFQIGEFAVRVGQDAARPARSDRE